MKYFSKLLKSVYNSKCKRKMILSQSSTLGYAFQLSNAGIPSDVIIHDHCEIHGILTTRSGGRINIGANTYVGSGTDIMSKCSINIGNCVIISNDVMIVDNNNHPTDPQRRREMCMCGDFHGALWSWEHSEGAPIVIGDNVWIGRNAVILKGVTVGEGAIVAMHSVVTHDVPPYTIVAGNPGKVVKHLEKVTRK